jgi:RND family efflux transporter MFP subunit
LKQKDTTMNAAKTMAVVGGVAVLIGAIAIGSSGCREAQSAELAPIAIPALVAATPVAVPVAPELEIAGDLKPALAAELSFKIGGQLGHVRVTRGQAVKAGDVIAVLSDAEAQAQLAAAEAAVAAAEAQAALAADQASRVAELAKAEAAPASQATATKHQAAAAAAVAQQAKAARDLARVNADNHVLRAPFAGVMTRVKDQTGETMGPGMPVARLERLDLLVLQATLSENEIDRVKVGDVVIVKTAQGVETAGRVRALVRSLDAMSRRAPLEIEVPNADGKLAAGAYVRAELRRPVATN